MHFYKTGTSWGQIFSDISLFSRVAFIFKDVFYLLLFGNNFLLILLFLLLSSLFLLSLWLLLLSLFLFIFVFTIFIYITFFSIYIIFIAIVLFLLLFLFLLSSRLFFLLLLCLLLLLTSSLLSQAASPLLLFLYYSSHNCFHWGFPLRFCFYHCYYGCYYYYYYHVNSWIYFGVFDIFWYAIAIIVRHYTSIWFIHFICLIIFHHSFTDKISEPVYHEPFLTSFVYTYT